jgi:hypothetical protein
MNKSGLNAAFFSPIPLNEAWGSSKSQSWLLKKTFFEKRHFINQKPNDYLRYNFFNQKPNDFLRQFWMTSDIKKTIFFHQDLLIKKLSCVSMNSDKLFFFTRTRREISYEKVILYKWLLPKLNHCLSAK